MTKRGTTGLWALTVACLTFFASIPACAKQTGKFVVSSRKTIKLPHGSGSMDVLFGFESGKAIDSRSPLLVMIACDPDKNYTKATRTGGDGVMVSAINVTHYEDNKMCFHYGCAWNRTSDKVAIDSGLFDRANGSAFLLVPMNNDVVVFQLMGIDTTNQVTMENILCEVSNQITSHATIPENVRQYFFPLEKNSN